MDEDGKPKGFGLSDAQIAEVVGDVVRAASDVIDHHDPVSLDEFCELTADDNCDLVTLVNLYKHREGDEEALESLLNEGCVKAGDTNTMNRVYKEKCRRLEGNIVKLDKGDIEGNPLKRKSETASQPYMMSITEGAIQQPQRTGNPVAVELVDMANPSPNSPPESLSGWIKPI